MILTNLIGGLVNISLFVLPVPLIAWLDQSKSPIESVVEKRTV